MFITGLDQSWFKTPFLRHQWRVKRDDEITLLRSYGIQEVIIDTDQGTDLVTDIFPSPPAPSFGSTHETTSPLQAHVPGPNPDEIQSARVLRAEAISTLDMFFRQMEPPDSHHIFEVRSVVGTLLDGILEHQAAMISLIQMRRFDADLASHGVDTGVLSMAIGQEHGCEVASLKALGLAALLHDIGQLRLPLNLVRKPTPYTARDHKVMQGHPEMSLALLKPYPELPEETRQMILHHHERLDGSGYPHHLKDSHISDLTQILSIADTYDAQISGRCSDPPVPPSRALSELYRTAVGGQYHLHLVQRLIQLLGVYPIGTLVRLTTNEQAIVVWVARHARLNPTIKLLKDPSGNLYPDQDLIDLSAQPAGSPQRAIVEALDPQQEGWDVPKLLESLW